MKQVLKISFVLLLLIGFSSCYENREGCLDVEATNFDASADESCCCVYPQFSLSLTYSFNGKSFHKDSIYRTTELDSLKVLDFGLLFGATCITSQGTKYVLEDSTDFYVGDATDSTRSILPDNIMYVHPDKLNYEAGTFTTEGTFDSIFFLGGLEVQRHSIRPATLDADHPLAVIRDKGYWNSGEGFGSIVLSIAYGEALKDTTRIVSVEDAFSALSVGKNLTRNISENISVQMDMDLYQWLDGIDFPGTSQAEQIATLKSNLQSVFICK